MPGVTVIVGTRRLVVSVLAAAVRADARAALAVVSALAAVLVWIGARTRRPGPVRWGQGLLRGYHARVHPRWVAAAVGLRAWA